MATSLSISPLTGLVANKSFPVTVSLAGYPTLPTLDYADSATLSPVANIKALATSKSSITLSWAAATETAVWIPLPSNASMSMKTCVFTHPGLPAGNHTLEVTDGNITAAIRFSVGDAPVVVTHQTVLAEITAFQKLVPSMSAAATTALNKIITDVGKLTP